MSVEYLVDEAGIYPTKFSCHAVKTGNTIYSAGIVGKDKNNNIVGGNDEAAQITQVFKNIEKVLQLGGASFQNVVKCTFYLTDVKHASTFRNIRKKYIPEHLCSSTIVTVKELGHPSIILEAEFVAVV